MNKILTLLVISPILISSSSKIDSLQHELKNSSGKNRIHLLQELAEEYIGYKSDTAYSLSKMALNILFFHQPVPPTATHKKRRLTKSTRKIRSTRTAEPNG